MPPAISDDENSDVCDLEVVAPMKREKKPVNYAMSKEEDMGDDDEADSKDVTNGDANGNADEEDEEDEEEGDAEEYVVEKIVSHFIADDGKPRFEVKWEGFEKKSDHTFEPEENLRGTADGIINEYLEKIGGVGALYRSVDQKLKGKKRGRPSAGMPASTTKKSRKNRSHPLDSDTPSAGRKAAWKPPVGSWEDHIDSVDMTRDEQGDLIVWISWKNGEKSQHKAQQAYTRAPQKMLKFYESKINFTGPA